MDNQRLILFIIFSFSIIMLWDAWDKQHAPVTPISPVTTHQTQQQDIPTLPSEQKTGQLAVDSTFIPTSGKRIHVYTDTIEAEIDLLGGDLRHLALQNYKSTHDKTKNFVLLDAKSPTDLYLTQTGLLGAGLPTHKSQFIASQDSYELSNGKETLDVKLEWQDNTGIKVEKIYTFHRGSYVIDVHYEIHNNTAATITPSAYYQLVRDGNVAQESRFVSTFTGVGYFTEAEKYKKQTFADIEKNHLSKNASDGWIGIVQHYFVSAWIPKQGVVREFYTKALGNNIYSAGAVVTIGSVAPGASAITEARLFSGPQEQAHLKTVTQGLEYTVDYGWLTVIATPLFWLLYMIEKLVHNWGIAIITLTVLIKAAFYPLSAASYKSMAHMKKVAPRLQQMKERYGDDREKLQKAMMELYKTEKINPMGGCLPILVQVPVFIALYWVLLGSVELRQAPFMLWINDLSVPDPYYVLPLLMAASMIIQGNLNPPPPDPVQAKVMKIMPVVFSVFFFFFPAGLVLYWLVNNVLSILQQWRINSVIEGGSKSK